MKTSGISGVAKLGLAPLHFEQLILNLLIIYISL